LRLRYIFSLPGDLCENDTIRINKLTSETLQDIDD